MSLLSRSTLLSDCQCPLGLPCYLLVIEQQGAHPYCPREGRGGWREREGKRQRGSRGRGREERGRKDSRGKLGRREGRYNDCIMDLQLYTQDTILAYECTIVYTQLHTHRLCYIIHVGVAMCVASYV